MDIDMAALRALEHEKDISFEVVVDAIETALLSAYHKTGGSHSQARVELNRKNGHVTVWAKERLEIASPEVSDVAGSAEVAEEPDHKPVPQFTEEFDDTPTTSDDSPPPLRAS